MNKKYYQIEATELITKFNSNQETGLSNEEAQKRLKENGPNKLKEEKRKSLLLCFFSQLNDFMVYVLFGAAAISILLAIVNQDPSEIFEGVLILSIVILNAIMGIVQEGKAQKALDAIKKMSSPHTTVLRNGIEQVINIDEVVVGDIVIISAGDIIPADVRILESYNLKVDESALTGEPIPVEKISNVINTLELPLGDQQNLAFMNTVATYGRAKALVIGTSMNTEIGKIADMIEAAKMNKHLSNNRLINLVNFSNYRFGNCCGIFIIIYSIINYF